MRPRPAPLLARNPHAPETVLPEPQGRRWRPRPALLLARNTAPREATPRCLWGRALRPRPIEANRSHWPETRSKPRPIAFYGRAATPLLVSSGPRPRTRIARPGGTVRRLRETEGDRKSGMRRLRARAARSDPPRRRESHGAPAARARRAASSDPGQRLFLGCSGLGASQMSAPSWPAGTGARGGRGNADPPPPGLLPRPRLSLLSLLSLLRLAGLGRTPSSSVRQSASQPESGRG